MNRFLVALATSLCVALPMAAFADAPPAPTTQEIVTGLNQAFDDLRAASVPMMELYDAAARKAAAPRMIPPLKKVIALLQQAAKSSADMAQEVAENLPQLRLRLLILADPDTVADAQKLAAGQGADADEAAAELAVTAFFIAHGDAPGQLKALDQYAIAVGHKTNPAVLRWIGLLVEIDPAGPAVADSLIKIIKDNVPSPDSDQLVEQITDAQKLAALVNTPLVVTGSTVDGKAFTTADWKGKVVMIDLWATWCQPCVEEYPHVRKLYDTYHDKGFEIVGVSNDFSADDLNKFVADNQVPWPQLFDPAAAAQQNWNAISRNLSVNSIPEMIVIDRKGVVRTVNGQTEADNLLPKLLAEPAGN